MKELVEILWSCHSGLMKIKFHSQTRGKAGKFSKLMLFLAVLLSLSEETWSIV
jgi:hypothetical protein